MNEEIVERLELRLAYLERANNELSDVVYRQQLELTQLRQQLDLLASRVEVLKGDEPAYSPQAERPPHY